jgi:hypothetical protein
MFRQKGTNIQTKGNKIFDRREQRCRQRGIKCLDKEEQNV